MFQNVKVGDKVHVQYQGSDVLRLHEVTKLETYGFQTEIGHWFDWRGTRIRGGCFGDRVVLAEPKNIRFEALD